MFTRPAATRHLKIDAVARPLVAEQMNHVVEQSFRDTAQENRDVPRQCAAECWRDVQKGANSTKLGPIQPQCCMRSCPPGTRRRCGRPNETDRIARGAPLTAKLPERSLYGTAIGTDIVSGAGRRYHPLRAPPELAAW